VPHFVLPTTMGTVEVINTVPGSAVIEAVAEINSLSKA
jgi:hypothetical protein